MDSAYIYGGGGMQTTRRALAPPLLPKPKSQTQRIYAVCTQQTARMFDSAGRIAPAGSPAWPGWWCPAAAPRPRPGTSLGACGKRVGPGPWGRPLLLVPTVQLSPLSIVGCALSPPGVRRSPLKPPHCSRALCR